jgi:hydroxyethylthiazole kinase-like uncharacterized protein yjeF
MTELLTAAQMRAIEAAAIASGEVTGLELMERAGRGVVAAIFEEWPELAEGGHRAVVLCGPGNNGGDGFVVARLLREAGWDVEVFLYGDAEKLPPDARVNYERWDELGEVGRLDLNAVMRSRPFDVWFDAVLGTGLKRHLHGPLFEVFDYVEEDPSTFANRSVAIDIATGLCSDSGRFLGPVWEPALTVTFHSVKLGHVLYDGGETGSRHKLRIVDIGLNTKTRVYSEEAANATTRSTHFLHKRRTGAHKYYHGHAVILSGGVGKGGAARLAARGALRVGAGAVTVGCPPAALIENAAQLNAIMLRKIKDAGVFTEALEDARINALCMGPGMGVSDESRDLVEAGLKSGRAMVLDADALTLIGRDAPLFASLHDRCVLTPHAGEFARLFPDIAEKLAAPAIKGPAYSKVDATRDAARRAGCVVLFKGPDTVIAAPDGRCSINASVYERSAPWLATAGSGDVLAGFITGLLARGFVPMQAAESGAWLHTECALSFGPGLIAEDLPEELPKVFRALGL